MAQHYPGRKYYTMYHGTTMEIARKIKRNGFVPSSDGMLGRGVYLSRSFDKAARYPLNDRSQPRAVLKLKVRVGRVKRIDCQDHYMQKTWHDHGYDTAWVPPNCGMVPSGLEEDCVYDPWRITVLEIIPNNTFLYFLEDISEEDCGTMAEHYPGHRYFTMYHGTTMENAKKIELEGFEPSPKGMLGRGVYLSRSFKKAAAYPKNNRSQPLAILKLRVRVGRVKRIDYQGHYMQKTWHDHGYDTAWVPPNAGMVPSGLEEDCVYDPWRITVLEIIPNNQP
ncbi:LOW QUALITY PROTEIN: grass carp reovirus (GCRV)-induced gene 2q [Astyanax mexicanus]|uniref:LOW QUALITY PROTEIN: grass carp reovirus (GCRV)-induced gene 2q n=1 Tax=Astyanax mexicanus TaxID=7994 RepID=UPI0020CB5A81|nr:LOW QUALITY PROTEIN: grass carp reovirus (GCRV)-induced gene 2q [Astyanax mexicanus]